MNKIPRLQTAHIILFLSGKYLLQLRDNKPSIAAPGHWALFGGMLKDKETPLQAIRRELFEELAIKPPKLVQLWFDDFYASFEKTVMRIWFFAADVSAVWNYHRLNEGKSVVAFASEEIINLKMHPVMKKAIVRYHNERKYND